MFAPPIATIVASSQAARKSAVAAERARKAEADRERKRAAAAAKRLRAAEKKRGKGQAAPAGAAALPAELANGASARGESAGAAQRGHVDPCSNPTADPAADRAAYCQPSGEPVAELLASASTGSGECEGSSDRARLAEADGAPSVSGKPRSAHHEHPPLQAQHAGAQAPVKQHVQHGRHRDAGPSTGHSEAAAIDPGSDPGGQRGSKAESHSPPPPPPPPHAASEAADRLAFPGHCPGEDPGPCLAPSSASGTPTAGGSAAGGDDELNPTLNPSTSGGGEAGGGGAAGAQGELRREWDALLAEAAACRDGARQAQLAADVRSMAERCGAAGISLKYGKKVRSAPSPASGADVRIVSSPLCCFMAPFCQLMLCPWYAARERCKKARVLSLCPGPCCLTVHCDLCVALPGTCLARLMRRTAAQYVRRPFSVRQVGATCISLCFHAGA